VPGLSLCSGLASDELAALNSVVVDGQYGHGETLFDEDRPDDSVYVVTNGAVRLYRILPNGRRLIFGFALPGDFLGHAIERQHACSADALGPVAACKMSRAAFSALLNENPHLLRRLQTETARELSVVYDHMLRIGFSPARENVAAFLLKMRTRLNRASGKSNEIMLPMTRQDIGDYLGLTIETVSRKISEFVREKLIAITPGGLNVLDLATLERIGAMTREVGASARLQPACVSEVAERGKA
jgi:CRP/FNR family transcriptional regulator